MNKNESKLGFIILIAVLLIGLCFGDKREEPKTSEPPQVKDKSSYWYDDPATRKRKADETLNKYYTRDENGNLKRREGIIVNGKPWKEE